MRTPVSKNLLPALALALAVIGLHAQPGPGMGGMGPRWQVTDGNTPGMALMTPQERLEHQNRMRAMQSYDECVAYIGDHHARMVARAQEQGVVLAAPRNPCETMRSRGRLP